VKYDSPRPEPYSPIPVVSRESIWEDACAGDMKDAKGQPLPPACPMIVILGLAAGMRRAEIEAARVRWFSPQSTECLISIQEEQGFEFIDGRSGKGKMADTFQTKSRKKRIVPIDRATWEILVKLRGDYKGEFFVPRNGKKLGGEYSKVMDWLHGKGIADEKALHSMRKEAGSIVAATKGIVEASRFLGQADIHVTNNHYAGVEKLSPVAVKSKSLVEQVADQYGIDPKTLKKWLESNRGKK
jgi:integrase